ncbi:MAG: 30S ribosomal protein S19 [Thermodesulfobacteriota bacterium]
MPRSSKKGIYVDSKLMKKVDAQKDSASSQIIRTWSRSSMVIPEMIGLTFGVYNGKKFIPVYVSEHMVGHKLGEFSPTRTYHGHVAGDKRAKRLKGK